MQHYRTIDAILEDRRKGLNLAEIITGFAKSSQLQTSIENPFDLFESFQSGDILDISTESWCDLTVELQQKYSKAYQVWYAKMMGLPNENSVFSKNGKNIPMTLIPPVKFKNRYGTTVRVFEAFWMGITPITRGQNLFLKDQQLPRLWRDTSATISLPQVNFSPQSVAEFCRQMDFFLPTPDQWELACRAGTTYPFYFGLDFGKLGEYAWYKENSNMQIHSVGLKKPNTWGLYDMLGNVQELCYHRVSGPRNSCYSYMGGCYASESNLCLAYPAYASSIDVSKFKDSGFRVIREFKPIKLGGSDNVH